MATDSERGGEILLKPLSARCGQPDVDFPLHVDMGHDGVCRPRHEQRSGGSAWMSSFTEAKIGAGSNSLYILDQVSGKRPQRSPGYCPSCERKSEPMATAEQVLLKVSTLSSPAGGGASATFPRSCGEFAAP